MRTLVSTMALGLSVFVAGCAADASSEDDPATGTDDVVQFRPDSTYTSVEEGCKVIEEGEEAATDECAGPKGSGLKLEIWNGDLRMRAAIVGRNKPFAIDVPDRVPFGASWNTVGPKAEWRTPQGKSSEPYALILRHAFEMDPENPGKNQHYLGVVKIAEKNMCLVGIVEASKNSANANTIARKIADDARIQGCPKTVSITTK
jgi:hypothetical protein